MRVLEAAALRVARACNAGGVGQNQKPKPEPKPELRAAEPPDLRPAAALLTCRARPAPHAQALQGAKMAAKAGATLAPLAAAQPAGGKPANPFLGNSHLSEQRT